MNESTLGFIHFIQQADSIARFILVVMVIASLLTWVIIVDRLVDHWMLKRRSGVFWRVFGVHVRWRKWLLAPR